MEWPDRRKKLDDEQAEIRRELVETIAREWRLPFLRLLVSWLECEWQTFVNTNHYTEAAGLRQVIDHLTSLGDAAQEKVNHGPHSY